MAKYKVVCRDVGDDGGGVTNILAVGVAEPH